VWAWVEGQRRRTHWRSLPEIESAFSHVYLLKIQRNILLHPEMVLAIHPAFGGTAKVTVAGGMELDVSKAATQRLQELLGL
jgi:DNA-binding LytR/AlgR family response regulator